MNILIDFEIFFFFFFSSIILSSAVLVIRSKNPVHSILFLILVFCNLTGLLFVFEIEFLSILLIIIYVGAIAILFLFVVMMLDIQIDNFSNLYNFGYLPISLLLSLIFIFEILFIFYQTISPYYFFINSNNIINNIFFKWVLLLDNITNTVTLGQILYTYYPIFFLLSGIILLIALIGAVHLTLRKKKSENQDIFKQISRKSRYAVFKIKKL